MTEQEPMPDPTPPPVPEPLADLDADPALATAVLEIEEHVGTGGWDQPARLYALVDTAELVAREPALAAAMGLDAASEDGSFTPVEQDDLPAGEQLERVLETIIWPPEVAGCAAVVERLVLPPEVDEEIPERRGRGRGVRPQPPPAPGAADRGRCDPDRVDLLCLRLRATTTTRRSWRHRPRAGPARAAGRDPEPRCAIR